MLKNKKIVVVMPAFNAGKTLESTYHEIPHTLVDEVILVDDASTDNTIEVAQRLGIKHILIHDQNKGYGANQKSCYQKALQLNADIIIMLHPDYQYTPLLIPAMVELLNTELYQVVLASRILGKGALIGGMPYYKYLSNRVLTFIQNILLRQKLSEYHTGYRAYNAEVLKSINFENNSDDFVFDNEVLSQIVMKNYKIAEISCPTKYFPEASSINFGRSVKYGFGVLATSIKHFLHKKRIFQNELYK